MQEQNHIMQFKIKNSTSAKKTYTLFDLSSILANTGVINYTLYNKNNPSLKSIASGTRVGQVWKQDKTAIISSVTIKILPLSLSDFISYIIIRDMDTDEIIYSDSKTIKDNDISKEKYITFTITNKVDLTKSANYGFELRFDDDIQIEYETPGTYAEGYMTLNNLPTSDDLIFSISLQENPNIDITYSGDMTYDELVRTLTNNFIYFVYLKIIADNKDQLSNDLTIKRNTSTGDNRDFIISVEGNRSPFDVQNMVNVFFDKKVIFGNLADNETIEYAVESNSEVILTFGFNFLKEILSDSDNLIKDTENIKKDYKSEKLRNTLKQALKDVPKKNNIKTPANSQKEFNIVSFAEGMIGTLIILSIGTIVIYKIKQQK